MDCCCKPLWLEASASLCGWKWLRFNGATRNSDVSCFGTWKFAVFVCVAMAVELRNAIEIKWLDDTWHSIPASLLVTHGGKQYLKMRPSHPTIVSLITSKKAEKNASFASSEAYAKMTEARNIAALKLHGSKKVDDVKEHAEEEQQEALFQETANESEDEMIEDFDMEPHVKRRKKAIPGGQYLVTINVGVEQTPVECLVQGARPARSDLLILLECQQLQAVFDALKNDVEACLAAKPRQYKKRVAAAK